ncbi:MAG TPA: hypothetical protein VGN51_22845 [Acidimicrobiia bacterium]|jgi:hypothetical protein
MFGKRRPRPEQPSSSSDSLPSSSLSDEQQRQEFHSRSEPIPTRPVRTVLVDVATDQQRGFWDAPLWLPVGGVLEGGTDLWEIVSVRLRMPTAGPEEGVRPVLYLYARKAEA